MRICLYTETALPKLGGQELVVDSLAREFVKRGHAVSVLAPYPRHRLPLKDDTYPYHMMRHPRFYSTRWGVRWYRRFLLRHFRNEPFDILHCHGLYPSGYLAAVLKNELGVPIVLTSHGGDVREKNTRLRRPVIKARHELAVRSADQLIAISEFTRQGYLRLGGSPERIIDISNGVDLADASRPVTRPAELTAPLESQKYFLFLGRLVRRKGVDLLLEAMRLLTDTSMPLVIAGDGDESDSLRRFAAEAGLNGRVHFLGRVGGEMKRWLLQNALCTILPSRDWEAFPLVALESYAAGRPMIATAIPGLVDVVRGGQTGLLVAENDPTALASAMKQMAADRAATEAMGQNARRWADDFSWSAIAHRHIEIYRQLISADFQPHSH
jgi:glycosyltransferase involved in cell wall biosynthesis